MSGFVHLRSHSQYSIVDGLMSPGDLVKMAAADNQPAVALTDAQRMFGTLEFYETARKNGVKPIVGVDAWVEPDLSQAPGAPAVKLLLLAQDNAGYKRLMQLVSQGYMENQVNSIARIKQSWLAEGTAGIIALSGGEEGEIAQALIAADAPRAATLASQYAQWFPNCFYLEVQRAGFANEEVVVQGMANLSSTSGIPLVATHPIQFSRREDYLAHEVKYCVVNSEIVYDLKRPHLFTPEQHFQTEAQMRQLFADIPEAVDNAALVASRCSPEIQMGKSYLPHFPTPDGSTEDAHFSEKSRVGLEARLVELFPDEAARQENRARYEQRLQTEIDTIIKMGFPGYYLIVADFIQWSKDNGVPVGPGRGSGAGSLAAFALGITDIDPLPYDLLFERFLNPERVSMPDFDIDFCMDRRDEVIEYVKQRYGEASVGRISTYGFLKAKAAIKGAGRALGLTYGMPDELTKMIVSKPGEEVTIDDALERFPKLAERYLRMPEVRELLDVARTIEKVPQSIGLHAGGVLIAPGNVTDFAPSYLADAATGAQSQYDMTWVERAGLVKFDFLGLKTLTMLDKAVRLINGRPDRENDPFVISKLPLDDQAVYKDLGEGDTKGVFQFESSMMQGWIKKLKPERFEDLIALAALVRPGPLGSGMVDNFVDRRHGRQEVAYPHPLLERILEPTYGVIVYQEQVMQIAQVMAGYSLGGADLLRRAMGKKDAEKMAKERSKFEEGAAKKGIAPKLATEVFDLMEMFAEYGFNKSHSAAYALIAYQTAFIKTKYPAEFYAAQMSVNRDDADKIAGLVDDARRHKIKVLPPDVNEATAEFTPVGHDAIRYAFGGLKGIGTNVSRAIMQTRIRDGKFTSIFDFCVKMAGSGLNKTSVEALARAGAFDSMYDNRAQVVAAVPLALKYASDLSKAKTKAEQKASAPTNLLPALGKKKAPAKAREIKAILEPEMPVVEPWGEVRQLDEERKAVGFFLTGHPYAAYARQFGGLSAALPIEKVDDIQPGFDAHLVAGMVVKIDERLNAKKEKQAKVTIEDGRSSREITFFARTWAETGAKVKAGQFMAFEAKVSPDTYRGEGVNQLIAESVFTIEELRSMLANHVNVAIVKTDLPKLAAVLAKHNDPDGLPISVYLPDGDDRFFRADLTEAKLAKTPQAYAELTQAFGAERVTHGFASQHRFEPKRRFNNNNRRPR